MQLTTFLSVTFTILGLAAASPTEEKYSSNLAFVKRACDCPGVQACCKSCFENSDDPEKCCNTTCMEKFPDCYNAC